MNLKAKDEKIMVALLMHGSVAEAEKVSGASRSTIYKRLEDREFKSEYDRRRTLVLNEACAALQSTLTSAIKTIEEIIQNEENAPQVRLNACGLILQNCLKYTEQIEVLKKLEELEALIKISEGNQ